MNRHEDPQVNDEAIFDAWWYKHEKDFCERDDIVMPKDLARIAFHAGVACIEEGWVE